MDEKSINIEQPAKTRIKNRKASTKKQEKDDEDFKVTRIKVAKPDGPRYPKRQVGVKNYQEPEVPSDDRYVYCDFCDEVFLDDCDKCGQLSYLRDVEVPLGLEDRARRTLPKTSLMILPSSIHGLGVFAKIALKRGIKMGPYEGNISKVESTAGYSWKLRDGRLVDAADERFSNWMRYVNCARHYKEQNVVAFQYRGNLYYRTCRDIQAGQELLVYYGESFAKNLGIDVSNYFNPKEESMQMVYNSKSCVYCCYAYKDTAKLKYHINVCRSNPNNKQIVPDMVFNCRFCPAALSDEIKCKKHEIFCQKSWNRVLTNKKVRSSSIKTKMQQEKIGLNCADCGYFTKNKFDYETHKRIHQKHFLFSCKICKKGFNIYNNLRRHMINHLDSARTVTVLETKNVFDEKAKREVLEVDFDNEKMKIIKYECKKCEYKTPNRGNFKVHLVKHSKKTLFFCNSCCFCCSEIDKFEKHTKEIHNFSCEDCKFEDACKIHVKYQYTEDVSYHPCGICGLRFSRKDHLKSHLLAVHLGEKNYKCKICDYSASKKMDLNVHFNAKHSKSVKYECSLCEFSSYYKSDLRKHNKRKHA